MKQSRFIGIVLTIVNVILLVVCAVLYFKTDRTAPGFDFQATDIVYRSGMNETQLLTVIAAYDSNDGDVTDRIVIEKKIENEEEDSLVVFYAVSDKAGNVAKCSRVFPARYMHGPTQSEDDEAKLLMEAGIEADLEADREAEESESPEPVETPEATATPSPTPTETPTPTPTPEPTPEAPAPTQKPRETINPAAPVLTLKMSQVQTNIGSAPAWVNVIGTLKDDKDNYETLFRNLSISKYDKDKAGTYQVTVSTEDSDGNKSQTLPLTIIVK